MSNLGPYQDFVVAAKAAGGVAKHIASIERAAVSRYAPAIAGASVVVGAAGMALVKKLSEQRKADQVAAEEAKKLLISEFGNDGSQSEQPPTPPAPA